MQKVYAAILFSYFIYIYMKYAEPGNFIFIRIKMENQLEANIWYEARSIFLACAYMVHQPPEKSIYHKLL